VTSSAGQSDDHVQELAHAALRGAIAAMAMTGMRVVTVNLGIVKEPPPQQVMRQRARGLLKVVPRKRRRTAIELAHWSFGAGGGVIFGILPDEIRRRPWVGPVYGLAVWLGFELGLAPALGLSHAKQPRPAERLGTALDHVLYGLVLSEFRARPQETPA
jgi:hypothetical protein